MPHLSGLSPVFETFTRSAERSADAPHAHSAMRVKSDKSTHQGLTYHTGA